MSHEILTGLAAIFILGGLAQWVAWLIRMPSILLLLLVGFLVGPVTGYVDPDHIFGDLLLPVISLSVALILFEGGLSLRFAELRGSGAVVFNLVTWGALGMWLLSAASAHWLLSLPWGMATLFGAVTVVSGPTVIGPLLQHVRPTARVSSTLKWEGIIIDPIGAMLALLVFEFLVATEGNVSLGGALSAVALTTLVGTGLGLLGALCLTLALSRHLIPEDLESPLVFMAVLLVFVGANHLQAESGLFAVTAMGMAMANQRRVVVRDIAEFKENLRTMLISAVFILLAARIDRDALTSVNTLALAHIAVLMLIARPLIAFACSLGSPMTWRERLFIGCVMPRGIVAAAVSSVFALAMQAMGIPGAEHLVPLTFLVIVVTVAVYGLSAAPLAHALGLADANPQGCLIVGAHPWAREIAKLLRSRGFPVLMIDSNRSNIAAARLEGIPAHHGSALAETILDRLDLCGIGRLLALTPNDEANSLAALRFSSVFGNRGVYQLMPESKGLDLGPGETPRELRGRFLFADWMTHSVISDRFAAGGELRATPITKQFGIEEFQAHWGDSAAPLFLIRDDSRLEILTVHHTPAPRPDDTLVSLVLPESESPAQGESG
ncbi:sodium:proton antiporter [Candidatus Sumerlaeota bacterium]|nr:sodium:proton antiporter [Candidatus Sumerlaeota bacterium]